MKNSHQRERGFVGTNRPCLLHAAILAAWIAPLVLFFAVDRPLDRPFFSGARFDGDYAIAAQIVQASGGGGVDSFVWPAATTAALQAAAHRLGSLWWEYPADFFAPEQIQGNAENFYYNLEIAIYVGKGFALVGVLLLLWLTYLLLWRLTGSPWISLTASVYLSSTLSFLSHASWLRVEVWSLVFLAAGVLAGWEAVRSFSPRACGAWIFLAGILFSASVFAKINVLPVLAFCTLCLGGLAARKVDQRMRDQMSATGPRTPAAPPASEGRLGYGPQAWVFALLCLLLCPWWALFGVGPAGSEEASGYDLAVWQNLSPQRWMLGSVLMVAVAVAPLALLILQGLTRYFTRRVMVPIVPMAVAFGGLLAGGLAALYLIAAPMSNSPEGWLGHVERMVISLLGNVFSENPYLSGEASIFMLPGYWIEAGAALAHPSLSRLLTFWYPGSAGWPSWGFLTFLLPICLLPTILPALWLGKKGALAKGVIPHLSLALAGLGLAVVNEWFSLKRGEGLDIRYFLYTTWYLTVGAVFLVVAIRKILLARFPQNGRLIMRTGFVCGGALMVASVASTVANPMSLSDQQAKFGRQISTTIVNAPRLFRDAGIPGESSEWRFGSSWSPVLLEAAIRKYEETVAAEGRRKVFHFTSLPGEVQAYHIRADESWTEEDGLLWLEVALPLESIGVEQPGVRQVQMSVELDRGDSEVFGQPHAGFLLRPLENPGAAAAQFWSFPSSSWFISPGAVEFAAEVDLDPRADAVQFVLMWQPRFPQDSFFLFNPQVGWSNWQERKARWFAR